MNLLQGKKAVVTGGSSGIGKAIVREFIIQGARTVAVLDKDSVKFAVEELRYQSVVQTVVPLQVDISQSQEVSECLQSPELDGIDVLVNNAGIDMPYFAETPDEDVWRRIMETNLEGSRRVTEFVYRQMIREGCQGSIIFITSVHADFAFTNALAYDTSKGALRSYARGLALNLAPHRIRVNEVAPGFVYPTKITGHLTPGAAAELGKKVPLGRPVTPQEIANACVFLASDMASGITGAKLHVDGGFSLVGVFH